VGQHDVARRDAESAEERHLLQGSRAVLAVGQDGTACLDVGDGGRLEHPGVASRRSALAAGDLDDPRPMGCAADDRADVVECIDTVRDVRREQRPDLVRGRRLRPVARRVVTRVMDTGRCHDVDTAALADLCQQHRIAAGPGGHGIDDGPQPERLRRCKLLNGLVDIDQQEVGMLIDRVAGSDDQVLVGVCDTKFGWRDVTEHGADEAHAVGSSR